MEDFDNIFIIWKNFYFYIRKLKSTKEFFFNIEQIDYYPFYIVKKRFKLYNLLMIFVNSARIL